MSDHTTLAHGYPMPYVAHCVPALLAGDLLFSDAVETYVAAQVELWCQRGQGATSPVSAHAATIRTAVAWSLIEAVIATGQTQLAWGRCVFCGAILVEVRDVTTPGVLLAGCRFCPGAAGDLPALTEAEAEALSPLEAAIVRYVSDETP